MTYKDLSPKEFKEGIEQDSSSIILDVRTPAEIVEGNINGHLAINIMNPIFPEKIKELAKDKSYYIYCRSGNRSAQACKYMLTLGFTNLYNLKGGYMAWEDEF